MKVLIVDDEKIIRRGLVNAVPWHDFGVDTVLEARNGSEALILFRREQPAILLTDIKMPVMDGIALTEEVRKLSDRTQIIYLTGHKDIDYIRAAFQNNAVDYILKPVDYSELLNTLQKTIRQYRDQEDLLKLRLHSEQKLLQSAPVYIRKLLAGLLEIRFETSVDALEKLQFWGVELSNNESYAVLLVAFNGYADLKHSDRQMLSFGVENILQELLDTGPGGYAFHMKRGRFACIVPESEIDQGDPFPEHIHSALSAYLHNPVSIAVGPQIQGILNLYESYQHALELLTRDVHTGHGTFYYSNSIETPPVESFGVKKSSLEQLCQQLRTGDSDMFRHGTRSLLLHMLDGQNPSIEHLRSIFLFAAGYVLHYVSGQEVGREYIDTFTTFASRLYYCETTDAMVDLILNYMAQMQVLLVQIRSNPGANVVEKIKAFLEERLSDSPTINDIARHVYLTPQYICTLFKQSTGMTVNEYLTLRRVETAKKLLISEQYRLYEVAPLVGYQDVKYFSKTFKRLTGLTPSEYAVKSCKIGRIV